VPGCKDAKTVEEGKRYSAIMVEKVGPFKVEFPTTIEVLERQELTHIKAQASGADNKIGSRMKIDLDVNLVLTEASDSHLDDVVCVINFTDVVWRIVRNVFSHIVV